MSHHSISGTSAAPLRALFNHRSARYCTLPRRVGRNNEHLDDDRKGMRVRRRSRYSREPCAERRKQPTLKNAERKDMTMRTKPYLQRNSRTFRTLERRQGL